MAALGAVTQPDIITGKPKKVPAIIDDRWVQKNVNGCNSVAQLRESLREAGMKHKQQELERLVVAKATVQFAERLTAPILDETIEAVTDNMVGELVNQLAQQGLTLQDYVVQRKITIDAMRDDARKQAVANLRQGAVLDAIFRHEGMELTDEDIEQAMGVIAPGIEKQATESFKNNGFMFTVNETAQRMRATQWLLDNTKVEYED